MHPSLILDITLGILLALAILLGGAFVLGLLFYIFIRIFITVDNADRWVQRVTAKITVGRLFLILLSAFGIFFIYCVILGFKEFW
jgi:hypothetical protein